MTLAEAMSEAVRRASALQKAYAVYQHPTKTKHIVRALDGDPPKGWKRIAVYGEGTDALQQVAQIIK